MILGPSKKFDKSYYWYSLWRGRDSLYVYLLAIKNKNPEKVKVLIPAVSCIAVVHVIYNLNLEPIYIDLDAEKLDFDSESLRSEMSQDVLAIIHHSYFGHMVPNIQIQKDCLNILDMAQGNLCDLIIPPGIDMAFMSCQWNKQAAFGSGAIMGSKTKIEMNLEIKTDYFAQIKRKVIAIMKDYNIYRLLFKISFIFKQSDKRITKKVKFRPFDISEKHHVSMLKYLNQLKEIDLEEIVDFLTINKLWFVKSSNLYGEVRIVLKSTSRDQLIMNASKKRIFIYPWPETHLSPNDKLSSWGLNVENYPNATKMVNESIVFVFNNINSIGKIKIFITENLKSFRKNG